MSKLIDLRVSNKQSFDLLQAPVSSGVPIPPDLDIKNGDCFELIDESGEPIPVQCLPLSWYPDGKRVKWLLVSFLASVPVDAERIYTLIWNKERGTNLDRQPIAREEGASISIDNGRLRCTLRQEREIFSELDFRIGDHEWQKLSCQPVFSLELDNGNYTLGAPQRIELEDNGSVRTLIRLEGKYVARDGSSESNFTYVLRIEAWRDRAELRLTHTIINEGADAHVHGLSVEWAVPHVRAHVVGRSDGQSFLIRPNDTIQGVLSESFGISKLGTIQDPDAVQALGTYDWWACTNTGELTLATTIREFHERYPKSLEITQERLRVGLLPSSSVVKDSFPPADQVLDSYFLREGEARTHEMYFGIWPTEADEDEIRGALSAFHKPPLALAPWSWYTDSGALGDIAPRSAKYAEYEQAADESLAIYLSRRERGELYGDRNYGDDVDGRLGNWNNGEYDYTHVGMLHFLRGAELAWYEEFARPYAKHLMDIDVCHAGEGAGKIYQHSERHNSEPPKLGSHAWLRGLMEYYCFSGDMRAKEVALHVADTWSEYILNGQGLEGTERGITWPIISMLGVYQIIPNEKYLRAAKVLIELVIDCHDPQEGHFTGTMYRETTKDYWGTFVIGSPVLESLIMYEQLTGDERVKEIVVKAAQRLARLNWLEEAGEWEYTHSKLRGDERSHNAKTNKMVTPAVLYAYLYSGDEDLLNKSLLAYQNSVGTPAKSGKDLGQSYCFGIRIPALIERSLKMRSELQ